MGNGKIRVIDDSYLLIKSFVITVIKTFYKKVSTFLSTLFYNL